MQELKALVAAHGDRLPLDRAMLAIAREEYPDLDPDGYLRALDGWAEWARAMGGTPAALRRVVFEMAGFKGDQAHYYDPDNSLLNRVIDRRAGIPITLSIVYLEVGRRLGAPVSGVGFPGHFLVRHDDVLIDPFEGGRPISRSECKNILRGLTKSEVDVEPWMFADSTSRGTLARVLSNLKNAYLMKRDLIMAARTIDRLLIIDPERLTDVRDRGLIYAELGLASAAVVDLESYIGRSKAADRGVIESLLPQIRDDAAVMN